MFPSEGAGRLRVLIDTNIFIEILRKNESYIGLFFEMSDSVEALYNPIIEAELLAGAKEKDRKSIEFILSKLTCLSIDKYTGQLAGEYANKYAKSHSNITLDDFFIAASAKQHKCKLWTLNKKHFPMISKVEFV